MAMYGVPGGGGIGPKGPVFGHGGNARRIAFVCDASGSMINKMPVLKEQLTKAFQVQEETKIRLGRVLTLVGLISQKTVTEVLAIKIREAALSLCRWHDGMFRFARGVLPPDQEGVLVQGADRVAVGAPADAGLGVGVELPYVVVRAVGGYRLTARGAATSAAPPAR